MGKARLSDPDRQWEGDIRAIAAHKDVAAFARLFEAFAPRIKGLLIANGVPGHQAEELAADVMTTVWLRAETYDPHKASPAAWIFTIARNRRIDQFRRESHPSQLAASLYGQGVELPQTPEEALCAEERQVLVQKAIARLSPDHRDILLLSFFDDRPHSDIARTLNLPLGTVKSRLRLALARLRRMLGGAE